MSLMVSTEIRELVDAPNERLDVEYKGWLDLFGDPEARADLARHIAALANNGGGYIVFGIDDDMAWAGTNRYPKVKLDRDLIASIVKKYLDPTFQCDVFAVTSAHGNEHPVVFVPPHAAYPICAKSDGPQVRGSVRGIKAGTYYTRKAGPESAPILSPAEWTPIIRRCALHDRSSILGALDAALRGADTLMRPSAIADQLKIWHDAAYGAFGTDVKKHWDAGETEAWPGLQNNHYVFSYAIHCGGDGGTVDHGDLLEVLRQVNHEAGDLSRSASWLFYPYTRPGIAPRFTVDTAAGLGEEDFLECSLIRDPEKTAAPTFWRASTDGKATIVEPYLEDQVDWCRRLRVPVGSWFSPNLLARRLAELVRHARALAERFELAESVSFRCEWFGIAWRQVFDPNEIWHERKAARDDHRVGTGNWPVAALARDWPRIVSHLAAPVMRAFMTQVILTPEWVQGQSLKWK